MTPMRMLTALIALALVAGSSAVRAQALISSSVTASAAENPADIAQPQIVAAKLAVVPASTQALQLSAGLDVKAGDRTDPTLPWVATAAPGPLDTPWSRVEAQGTARWAASPQAKVEASMDRSLEVQALPARSDGSPEQDHRDAASAELGVELSPAEPVKLGFSERLADAAQTIETPGEPGPPVQLHTGESTADASVRLAAGPRVSFEADGRFGYGQAALRQSDVTDQGYAIAEPEVAAVLKPWRGAEWRLSFGHEVSALDLGAFAAVAEGLQHAADPAQSAALLPNAEWRTQARFSQTLPGAGSLGLTLTSARLDTTEELTRNVDGTDLPGSISGGERRQIDLSLAVPLGIGGLSLKSDAAARASEIVDPVTGAPRRLSGEAPYDARLSLVQDVKPLALTWGLQARAEGQQVTYTPEEASTAAQAATLGLFVEYHPKPFALRLQVDGMTGAERSITDAYYEDSRETDRIARIDHRFDGGPAFSLMLKKAL